MCGSPMMLTGVGWGWLVRRWIAGGCVRVGAGRGSRGLWAMTVPPFRVSRGGAISGWRGELAVVSGTVDLGSDGGRFVARVLGARAQLESDDKRRRLRRKHEELAAAGKGSGGGGGARACESSRRTARGGASRRGGRPCRVARHPGRGHPPAAENPSERDR